MTISDVSGERKSEVPLCGDDQHCIGEKSIRSVSERQRPTPHWRKVNQQYLLVVVTNTGIRKVVRTNTASQEGQPGAIMRVATQRQKVATGNTRWAVEKVTEV